MTTETSQEKVIEGELIEFSEQSAIAIFDPFKKELEELRVLVNSSHFDYTDEKQNKEARSLIYKVRQVKAAIDKARKQAKAGALAYGKALDSKAKEFESLCLEIISIHQDPIDELERQEQARKDAIEERLQRLRDLSNVPTDSVGMQPMTSIATKRLLDEAESFVVDASFDEFMAEATRLKDYAISQLQKFHEDTKKREEEAAELERLRQEKAEREQKEREDRIAREAAEKAEREAKEAREREQKRILEEQDNAFLKLEQFTEFANGDSVTGSELAIRRDALRNHLSPKKDWPRFDEYQILWNQTEILLAERYQAVSKAEQIAREKADLERQEQAAKAERERLEREQKEQQERELKERQKREANQKHRKEVDAKIIKAMQQVIHIEDDDAQIFIDAVISGRIPAVSIEY